MASIWACIGRLCSPSVVSLKHANQKQTAREERQPVSDKPACAEKDPRAVIASAPSRPAAVDPILPTIEHVAPVAAAKRVAVPAPQSAVTPAAAKEASAEKTKDGAQDALDARTLEHVRSLTAAKQRAVEVEDYEEAKRCKDIITRLQQTVPKLKELEDQKRAAVSNEDYDAAKALKVEIDRLRRSIEPPYPNPDEEKVAVSECRASATPPESTATTATTATAGARGTHKAALLYVAPPEPWHADADDLVRTISSLSKGALASLDSASAELERLEQRVQDIGIEVQACSDKAKLEEFRSALAQVEAKAKLLEGKGIDNVYTSELNSGQDQAKKAKKNMLKRLDVMFDYTEQIFRLIKAKVEALKVSSLPCDLD